MGVPSDSISRHSAFLLSCRRSATMAASSLGPSAPQFHESLVSLPSRLSSPLAWLCLAAYDTRSASVKPSWQVTKLMLFQAVRPSSA
jgi:hypothetical protein